MKNATYDEIWQKITAAKKCAFLIHKNPDLDTIGSALALHHALLSLQKESHLVAHALPIATKYSFMPNIERFKEKVPKDTDLIVTLDSASLELVAPFENIASVAIDHHKSNSLYADLSLVESHSASTGEVVASLLFAVNAKINIKCADSLMAAIISDTKHFSTPRVNQSTFLIVSRLIELGSDPALIATNILQNKPLAQMRIEGVALSSMQLFNNGAVAACVLMRSHMEDAGAKLADTSEISYMLLGATTVKIAVLLVVLKDGSIKGSLRAKKDTSVDLSEIAKHFGGGGHEKSAGFMVQNGSTETTLNAILKMLQ